jgi:trans-aconitate methyltransferase
VAQIGAEAPAEVVDLGCGSGELTVSSWPRSHELIGAESRQFTAGAEAGHR